MKAFTDALTLTSARFYNYGLVKSDYESLSKSKKTWTSSKILDSKAAVASRLGHLADKLNDIAQIKPANNLSDFFQHLDGKLQISQSTLLKANLMTDTITLLTLVGTELEQVTQRLKVRISQIRSTQDPIPVSQQFKIRCLNDRQLSWESAFTNITDHSSADFHGPLDQEHIIVCGEVLRQCSNLPVDLLISQILGWNSVSEAQLHGVVGNLLQWFPLLAISRGFKTVFVNILEAILNGSLMDEIFNLDQKEQQNAADPVAGDDNAAQPPVIKAKSGPPKGPGGRLPYHIVCIYNYIIA